MPIHSCLSGIHAHSPLRWEFADSTERANASTDVNDIGKFARQLDDDSVWMLTCSSPLTWGVVGGASAYCCYFYTKCETDDLLSCKSDCGHTHDLDAITDGTTYKRVADVDAFNQITGSSIACNIDASSLGFNADQVDGKNVCDSGTDNTVLWTADQIRNAISNAITSLTFKGSVIDILDTPVGGESTGDRYGVDVGASGAWAGHPGTIAIKTPSSWDFDPPSGLLEEGVTVWNKTDDMYYLWDGAAWGSMGSVISHQALADLQGGCTGEYYHLNEAEHCSLTLGGNSTLHCHDDRYYTQTNLQTSGQACVHWDNITNVGIDFSTTSVGALCDVDLTGEACGDILSYDSTACGGNGAWVPINGAYLPLDGSDAMTGDLDMGGNSICNVAPTSISFQGGNKIVANRFDTSGIPQLCLSEMIDVEDLAPGSICQGSIICWDGTKWAIIAPGTTPPPTGTTVSVPDCTTSSLRACWPETPEAMGYGLYLDGSPLTSGLVLPTYLIQGLNPSQTYSICVQPYNYYGCGPISPPVSATTCSPPPATPISLSTSACTSSAFLFSWASGGGGPLTNYCVCRDAVACGVTGGTSMCITGLAENTSYNVYVKAIGPGGTSSNASTSGTTCYAVPGAPSGLTSLSCTTSSICIDWTAGTGTISSYCYCASGVGCWSSGVNTDANVSGLSPSTSYSLGVRSIGPGGSSGLSSITRSTCTPVTPPNTPNALGSTNVTCTDFRFTWASGGGGTTSGYCVVRDGGSQGTTTNLYMDQSGLSASTTYQMCVCAYGPGGSSSWAGPLGVTTCSPLTPLNPPTGVAACNISTSQFILYWTCGGIYDHEATTIPSSLVSIDASQDCAYISSLSAGTTYATCVRSCLDSPPPGYCNYSIWVCIDVTTCT